MTKFAILLGSASEGFRQKKIEEMFDLIDSKKNAGDSIVTFANGISELMLELVMDNSVRQLSEGSHSELVSESIDICHSRARHGNLSENRDCRVKPDNDTNCKFGNDTDFKFDNDTNVKNDNAKSGKSNLILLYICTLQSVGESEKSIWLCGEEIRRDVILHYQKLAAECGIDMQVIFDSDSEMVSEEELGYEEVCSVSHSELVSESVNKQSLKQSADDNEYPRVQGDGSFGGAR